jgi:hypothetical protein
VSEGANPNPQIPDKQSGDTQHPDPESTVWLVCPKCRSRRQMPSDAKGQRILCRQCSTELIAATSEEFVRPSESADSAPAALNSDDDELLPEPPMERVEVFKTILEEPEPSPKEAMDEADEESLPLAAPSLSSFYTGVFTFPWWPNAILKWIILSVLTMPSTALLLAIAQMSADSFGVVVIGMFALVAFVVGLFALSYAASCLIDITVNTSYNHDKADDWPDEEWRDRLLNLLRVGYFLSLTAVPAAFIASFFSLFPIGPHLFKAVFAVVTFVIFPIVFLAALEAGGILPLSPATWRSLKFARQGWLVFYGISSVLIAIVIVAALLAISKMEMWAPVVFCPIVAAALFVYGRLLGKLALYILQCLAEIDELDEGSSIDSQTDD